MREIDLRVVRILREALDHTGTYREQFLLQRCAGDELLHARVSALLRGAGSGAFGGDSPAAAASDPLIGTHLGPFRVVEQVGRGGMGVVYRAEREGADFSQEVALKVIRRGCDFGDIRTRFLHERRILASLAHPNLARLIDGGVTSRGRPWFALEFVRGEPITQWCDAGVLDMRARLRLFLDVCGAVQHAHARLVVHRDLKPANILVDASGHVRLLDFGIAQLLDEDGTGSSVTHFGSRGALTPEYAAPEQLRGEIVGVATDVYALGVILYELICGVLPHALERHDLKAAERAVLECPHQPLVCAMLRSDGRSADKRVAVRGTSIRQYRKLVRHDLSNIVDKTLAKEPAQRYASVQALAEDVGRWLAGAPVQASGSALAYRLAKLVSRHRLAAGLAAFCVAALMAGTAATAWQMHETRIQRDDARTEMKRSDAMRDYLMLMLRDTGQQRDASSIGARAVFRTGAERLFEQFRDRPREGQTAALMLSDLFLEADDIQGATPLLEKLLQWKGIDDNPDIQANARYNLAQLENLRGNVARARQLLDLARVYWTARSGRSSLLFNESRLLQSRIERAEGRPALAIKTLLDAVAERRDVLATRDPPLGYLLSTLAGDLVEAGRYEEAKNLADQGHVLFHALGRDESNGALSSLSTRCNAALMLGQSTDCVADYGHVADQIRTRYGQSTELGAAIYNLGRALVSVGRLTEAELRLEEAQRIVLTRVDESNSLVVGIRITLAELLVRLGRISEAAVLADSAMDTINSRFAASTHLAAASYRSRARVRLAQGRSDEARADLATATRLYGTTGASGAAYIHLMEPLRHALEAVERD